MTSWPVITSFARHGWRAAIKVGLPAPLAVVAWLVYAASLDLPQLVKVLERWGRSTAGSEPRNRRFRIGPLAWTRLIVSRIVGPVLVVAAPIAALIAVRRRTPVPDIAIVPAAYVVVAVGASFVMSLKEPRFLIAVVPMAAVAIALVVDWGEEWRTMRLLIARRRSGGGSRGTSRLHGDGTDRGPERVHGGSVKA